MHSPRALCLTLILCIISYAIPTGYAYAAQVPSIDAELVVRDWWVAGPFLSGVREAGTDPLAFAGDAPDFTSPLLRPAFPSVLVPGAEVRWRHYSANEQGELSVDYPEVTEDGYKLMLDEWGAAAGNTVGYAIGQLKVAGGPRRALLELRGAGSATINGIPWPGDPYGNGAGMSPVLLQDGVNEIKVAIGGSQRFSLRFLPVEADVAAFKQSATLPDLVRGAATPSLIGLPVVNNTTEWVHLLGVTVDAPELYAGVKPCEAQIPPLCVQQLALELIPAADAVPSDYAPTAVTIPLALNFDALPVPVELKLDVKDPAQPRRVTFISQMDNSVQYYGLLPPSNYDPKRAYGLILSLHGAGVEAIGQASAYQPKDWAYVAAPTNRRPFGFDWQDWGQRDMLEVLAQVQKTCRIDENRIHLTGHSMGGHGTWLNALTYAWQWASAAPSAGWTRFDLYSPMFLRRNLLFGTPEANRIWQLAMRQDDTLALCENALNLPIYALEGGADDNVPPQQPRLLVERLTQLGCDVRYREVPGMGHWWDDPATPGTDCVDSAELNEFWKSHVRKGWQKKVHCRCVGGMLNNTAGWIDGSPEQLHTDMVLDAEVEGNSIIISTTNADYLNLYISPEMSPEPITRLMIDGDVLDTGIREYEVMPDHLAFMNVYMLSAQKAEDGHWKVFNAFSQLNQFKLDEMPQKTKLASHYWKDALMAPCTVVLPTGGTEEERAWCMQMARLYAYQWWYRGNGRLSIATDAEVLGAVKRTDNLICLGLPGSNKALDVLIPAMPLQITGDAVSIGGHTVRGADLAVKYIAQIPRMHGDGLCLVESGTSLAGLKRLPAMMGIYSGAGFPDWMVWDDGVKLDGQAGALAQGFFGINWEFVESLSYFKDTP